MFSKALPELDLFLHVIPYEAMSETSSNRWNLPPFGFTGHRSLATILSHHATAKLSAEIVR
jgi:hypothetical protein